MIPNLKIKLTTGLTFPSISPDGKYLLRRRVGRGSEGIVYEAVLCDQKDGAPVALKIFRPIRSTERRSKISLKHSSIISLQNVQSAGRIIYQIMELCDEDVLSSILKSKMGRLSENSSRKIFMATVNALQSCHDHQIFHGDIKPENLLLANGQAKLADFYYDNDIWGCKTGTSQTNLCSFGSQHYLAPELLSCPEHPSSLPASALAAADVWALGLTLFVMAAGYKPWEVASDKDPGYKQFRLDAKSMWPTWFSEDLCSLLKGMLHHEASLRLSLLEVWEHSWVVNERWNEPRPPLEALRIDQQCVVEMGSEAGQANTPESCPCEDPHMSPRKRRKSSNS
eukprot:CAMPEP_0182438100 /NCGR_PEP_ID=MMETSP1167-20130531/85511_1 /TAXON_ID=2988 /ORGANISM="Mallomonas Sp, Strain CCMP3275" /LENGTH=338 /DNA_ID=CAMNT_0024631285 /DNA_START=63 /DNA_END=1079 /DNA_ORIENTATION=+